MKKVLVMCAVVLSFSVSTAFAQKISQNQIPSVILNSFQQAFPKASDVEWKQNVNGYRVEFETGIFEDDHEVWYDQTGKMLKHKEDLSKRDLPKAIIATIRRDYNGYKIEGVDKITEGSTVTYKVEIEKRDSELDLVFNADGKVLGQKKD